MNALEIALFVLAIAFVIISFFLVDNNQKVEEKAALADARELNAIGAGVLDKIYKGADDVVSETEERLKELSNDKIMAVGEYSDQVIEKIDNNHKEVVFLYQMLQDKEKELKNMSEQLEAQRRECARLVNERQSESVSRRKGGQVQENTGNVPADVENDDVPESDELRKKTPEVKKQTGAARKTQKNIDNPDTVKKTARSADALISRKSQTLKNDFEKSEPDNSLSERNREIIELYHQKKSVMEISKLLDIGQGEVNLIIELYDK